MSSRVLAAAVCVAAMLLGCPDAVRGTAPPDGGPGAGGDGGSETDGDGALDAKAPASPPKRIGDASGQLALGADRLFVATKKGIVSLPADGATTGATIVAGSITRPIAADATHLLYQLDVFTLDVATHAGTNPRRLTSGVDVYAFAVDQGRVFFATSNAAVRAVDLEADAAAVTTLRDPDSVARPILLALTPGYVVLCINDTIDHTFRIVRRSRSAVGGSAEQVVAKVSHVLALRTEGNVAYWLADDGIGAADIEGTTTPARVDGAASRFDGAALAVDATHVFWTSRTEGRLYRAPRSTGVAEVLATDLAFDDETVRELELDRSGSLGRVAVDSAAVYVSDRTGVFRIAKP